jgi:hypothetical protein
MNLKNKILLVVCIIATNTQAQDLARYEVIDLNSIGMVPEYVDRWGASAVDIDKNGWPDLFATKWRGAMSSQIYLNNGGTFRNIMANSPDLIAVEHAQYHTRVNVFADYDNDGDQDLVFGGDEEIFLFQNNDNVFINVSLSAGIKGIGRPGFVSVYGYDMGAWADYDLDGDIDLLVCQTNNPDFYLFKNTAGNFVDVAAEVGLTNSNPLGEDGDAGTHSARIQWIDFDLDGDPDFSAGWLLFRNDDGYFSEVSESLGLTPSHDVEFSTWFDYDNDGDFDFLKIVHWDNTPTVNELWSNENGTFVEISDEVGINIPRRNIQAALNTGDYDNDGDQDVFIQINEHSAMDVLWLNEQAEPGVNVFVDIAPLIGLTKKGDRKSSVYVDYDMDGFLDLFLPSVDFGAIMYHNLGNNNNWVGFILEGTESNRDAVGTLVTLVTGNSRQMRYTKAPQSWKVQEHPYIHFGIGQSTTIDSVIIRWPLGRIQVLTDVTSNQYHKIQEPGGTSVKDQASPNLSTWKLLQNYPNPFNSQTIIEYEILKSSFVTISIFNLNGQKIKTLVSEVRSAGLHSNRWDGTNESGEVVSSGTFLYTLEVDKVRGIRKLVYLK